MSAQASHTRQKLAGPNQCRYQAAQCMQSTQRARSEHEDRRTSDAAVRGDGLAAVREAGGL